LIAQKGGSITPIAVYRDLDGSFALFSRKTDAEVVISTEVMQRIT